ncbi:hypothetical protein LOAG_02260 [Loa loa]|uniref:Uncharacterized protein n=1 Tax=Loa loa TaxID=7209 RepID=A0A1S0U8X7_LOALO|nr:hypothetical protein LOAG_02260 [Loa loa]EFO26220.1 hypothetical protein LOAG_02260 [Loa loa]
MMLTMIGMLQEFSRRKRAKWMITKEAKLEVYLKWFAFDSFSPPLQRQLLIYSLWDNESDKIELYSTENGAEVEHIYRQQIHYKYIDFFMNIIYCNNILILIQKQKHLDPKTRKKCRIRISPSDTQHTLKVR